MYTYVVSSVPGEDGVTGCISIQNPFILYLHVPGKPRLQCQSTIISQLSDVIGLAFHATYTLQVLRCVWSNYDLQILWHGYSNRGGTLANGQCCRAYRRRCIRPCMTNFEFCLRPTGTPKNSSDCSLGRIISNYVFQSNPISIFPDTLRFHVEGNWTVSAMIINHVSTLL